MLKKMWKLSLAGVLLGGVLFHQAQARVLETAFGEVEVSGTPERVVTVYEGALDAALAAGVTPLGAVTTRGGTGVAAYIDDAMDTSELEIVGAVREINIEAILRLQPDVILAAPGLSAEQYQLLSRIAPTVVPVGAGMSADNWKDEARLYGQALQREAEMEAAIDAVEQRTQEVAQKLAEAGVGGSAFLVRWMPAGPMVMSSNLFSSGLITHVGLEIQDEGLVPEGSGHSDVLSLENLSLVDADWLFLATLNEDGRAALEAAKQSNAFARLNVVQNDRVVPVDGQLWSSASGPLAAQAILDGIEEALLP